MLPDFPDSRREIDAQNRLQIYFGALAKSAVRVVGVNIIQHEGKLYSHEQVTPSGTKSVTEEYKEMSIPFETKFDEIPELVGEKLKIKIDGISDAVARQQSLLLFSKLEEVTRATGNAVDAGGGPPTKEVWLKMLQGMEIDFDPLTRRPKLTFIAHPVMAETMMKLGPVWESDEDFTKERDEILAMKFEDWRDRESRRKLVD